MREAVIQIPRDQYDDLGLAGFLRLCEDAGLRDLTELVCQSDGCLLVVTVESPLPAETLDAREEVVWWERLSGADDAETYLCKVTAEDRDLLSMAEVGLSNSEIRVGEDGFEVTLVGTQDDIARGIDAYEEAGLGVLLRRMGDYDGPSTALDALTDRQREILRTGFELGYFEIPREATTADVADELGLDPSTAGEHLQRAERNLVSALFAAS